MPRLRSDSASRYWENITRHVTTTLIGAVCILGAVALVLASLLWGDRSLTATEAGFGIALLGAGGYLLGATGLLDELAKLLAALNRLGAFLRGRR